MSVFEESEAASSALEPILNSPDGPREKVVRRCRPCRTLAQDQEHAAAGFRDGLRLRAFNSWVGAMEEGHRHANLVHRGGAAPVSAG